MGAVADRLERLTINAHSPDRSVRVTLDRAAGITVALRPRIQNTHTERSLAGQVQNALTAAFTAYDRAIAMIREGTTGNADFPRGSAFAERLESYRDGVGEIVATGLSPHEHVEVEWRGKHGFSVTIERGTFEEVNEESLTYELNWALRSAAVERTDQVLTLYRSVYQAGVYEKETN